MADADLHKLIHAFRAHGFEPPPEYLWIVEHRMLGFDAFTQFEPWHLCGAPEIVPLSTRWPTVSLDRDLMPFARRQDSDDLACFELADGKPGRIRIVHYDLGPPTSIETGQQYATLWDWLRAALADVQVWFEMTSRQSE